MQIVEKTILGALFTIAVVTALPANAEDWVIAGSTSMAKMCVDRGSIKTDVAGVTHYRTEVCGEEFIDYHIRSEVEVRCDQDFRREQIELRARIYSRSGKLKPNAEWHKELVDLSSASGLTAKWVCKR